MLLTVIATIVLQLEAVEIPVRTGVVVQVTASGEVTELTPAGTRPLPVSGRRRAQIRRAFAEPVPHVGGWLSYVPEGLEEQVVKLKTNGRWTMAPVYRACRRRVSSPTADLNARLDRIAALAGYRYAFRCARSAVGAAGASPADDLAMNPAGAGARRSNGRRESHYSPRMNFTSSSRNCRCAARSMYIMWPPS